MNQIIIAKVKELLCSTDEELWELGKLIFENQEATYEDFIELLDTQCWEALKKMFPPGNKFINSNNYFYGRGNKP